MRKTILTLASAAALAMPLVAFAPTAGARAGGTSCAKGSGTANFSPALPNVHKTNKVLATITSKGTESSCKGGGVTSAKAAGKIKFSKPGNCTTLLNGSGGSSKGTLTLTWNNGKTSTIAATLTQVSGQATQAKVAGPVTAGLFKGLKASQTISFAPTKTGGDCVNTDLKTVTYTSKTALVIK